MAESYNKTVIKLGYGSETNFAWFLHFRYIWQEHVSFNNICSAKSVNSMKNQFIVFSSALNHIKQS